MLNRISLATIFAVLIGMFAASSASAVPDRPATPPPTDFWQNKGFMNMAHQGGETEAPGNTLYAFKTAIRDRGADTLEMDGYLTEDGKFVITHDMEPHKTSNAPFSDFNNPPTTPHVNPDAFIMNQTLAELKQLDFGYKFRPNGDGHYDYDETAPAEEYIYRGIATGDKLPPAGYTANDFKIPTFREVLDALPNTPINVDMKAPGGDPALSIIAAQEVAKIMKDYPERSEDVIVASFYSPAVAAFHEENPVHKALSAGESELLQYVQTGGNNPIEPTPVALQPPDQYNLGGAIIPTVPVLRANADYDGFAIHVWPANGTPDNAATWQKVMDQGADGFFTDKPGALHQYLCETGVARPDGSPRCATQVCPEGQTGIAPDNCVDIPKCPEGQVGTPPDCTPPPCPAVLRYGKGECEVNQKAKTKKVVVKPAKRKIKAGQKVRVTVRVTATPGMGSQAVVRLKSSNRQVKLPKTVRVRFKYSMRAQTVKKTITVKATRKAKGKAKITAAAQGKRGTSVLKVVKAKKRR